MAERDEQRNEGKDQESKNPREGTRTEPSRPSGSGERDPKPRAAYLLGYLSVMINDHFKSYYEKLISGADHVDSKSRVDSAAERLDEVRIGLADEIQSDILTLLHKRIKKLSELNNRLYKIHNIEPEHSSFSILSQPITDLFETEWRGLRKLAERALPNDQRLRPLYELGAALGEYIIVLQSYKLSVDGEDNLNKQPDIRPLVRRVAALPPEILSWVPLLKSMAGLAPLLDQPRQAKFLKTFHKSHLPETLETAEDRRFWSSNPRFRMCMLMMKTDNIIEECLRDVMIESRYTTQSAIACSKTELLGALGMSSRYTKHLDLLIATKKLVLDKVQEPVGHARYLARIVDSDEHARVVAAIMEKRERRKSP